MCGSLYLPEGTSESKVTLVASFNNNHADAIITEAHFISAAVIRIKSSDAAQKLGIALDDISNGDIFVFELQTLANGFTTRSTGDSKGAGSLCL